jgi:hypothetical protein
MLQRIFSSCISYQSRTHLFFYFYFFHLTYLFPFLFLTYRTLTFSSISNYHDLAYLFCVLFLVAYCHTFTICCFQTSRLHILHSFSKYTKELKLGENRFMPAQDKIILLWQYLHLCSCHQMLK